MRETSTKESSMETVPLFTQAVVGTLQNGIEESLSMENISFTIS